MAFLISNRTVHCSALPWNSGTILDTNRTSVALDVSQLSLLKNVTQNFKLLSEFLTWPVFKGEKEFDDLILWTG